MIREPIQTNHFFISFFCACVLATDFAVSVVTFRFDFTHEDKNDRNFTTRFDGVKLELELEPEPEPEPAPSPFPNHILRTVPVMSSFFGPGAFGVARRGRAPMSQVVDTEGTFAKVKDQASAKAALGVVSPSKQREFLGVERSVDPYDREMEQDDARGYYTNPKNREYYRRIKTLQSVSRPTTISMGGEALLTASAGNIANVGNGRLVVRESGNYGGTMFKKGDHLECISDHQVFNKTAMREHKLLDALAEAYQFNAQRDAYRRPEGYTAPTGVADAAHLAASPTSPDSARTPGFQAKPRSSLSSGYTAKSSPYDFV